jgi:imidazoleglycerol-phosphate dehydratase
MSTKRGATVRRKTRETDIRVDLTIEGTGVSRIDTGMPFIDHMLELLARHSLVDLTVIATGDLHVDYHHTVEDIGLTVGEALDKALGSRKGIARYGWAYVPMDEALARAVVDLGGRPTLVKKMACRKRKLRDFELSLFDDFFRALVVQSRMNLHIDQMRGQEAHHAFEAVFKALARALRMACALDPRDRRVPSSKGTI